MERKQNNFGKKERQWSREAEWKTKKKLCPGIGLENKNQMKYESIAFSFSNIRKINRYRVREEFSKEKQENDEALRGSRRTPRKGGTEKTRRRRRKKIEEKKLQNAPSFSTFLLNLSRWVFFFFLDLSQDTCRLYFY